jgi:hypothetical protein
MTAPYTEPNSSAELAIICTPANTSQMTPLSLLPYYQLQQLFTYLQTRGSVACNPLYMNEERLGCCTRHGQRMVLSGEVSPESSNTVLIKLDRT